MAKTDNLNDFMTDLADSIREATGETESINAQSFSTRITGLGTGKQDKLVSGENIKTINGESILGSGNITIEGGSLTESEIAAMGFTKNAGTYSKPNGGIPKSDLASAVQTSLGKADTALQSYTEQYKGTVTGVKINGTTKNPSSGVVDLGTVITSHQDISGKQDKLVSGTNIKTINGTSILGSGDITISGGSSSGDKIITLNEGAQLTIAGMEPEKIYIVGTTLLTLTIESFADNGSKHQQYDIVFKTGGYAAPSLTLPDNVLWANGVIPEIKGETPYELSITCSKHGISWNMIVYKAVLTPFKAAE